MGVLVARKLQFLMGRLSWKGHFGFVFSKYWCFGVFWFAVCERAYLCVAGLVCVRVVFWFL